MSIMCIKLSFLSQNIELNIYNGHQVSWFGFLVECHTMKMKIAGTTWRTTWRRTRWFPTTLRVNSWRRARCRYCSWMRLNSPPSSHCETSTTSTRLNRPSTSTTCLTSTRPHSSLHSQRYAQSTWTKANEAIMCVWDLIFFTWMVCNTGARFRNFLNQLACDTGAKLEINPHLWRTVMPSLSDFRVFTNYKTMFSDSMRGFYIYLFVCVLQFVMVVFVGCSL